MQTFYIFHFLSRTKWLLAISIEFLLHWRWQYVKIRRAKVFQELQKSSLIFMSASVINLSYLLHVKQSKWCEYIVKKIGVCHFWYWSSWSHYWYRWNVFILLSNSFFDVLRMQTLFVHYFIHICFYDLCPDDELSYKNTCSIIMLIAQQDQT